MRPPADPNRDHGLQIPAQDFSVIRNKAVGCIPPAIPTDHAPPIQRKGSAGTFFPDFPAPISRPKEQGAFDFTLRFINKYREIPTRKPQDNYLRIRSSPRQGIVCTPRADKHQNQQQALGTPHELKGVTCRDNCNGRSGSRGSRFRPSPEDKVGASPKTTRTYSRSSDSPVREYR